jgi:hypothetical protein
MTRPLTLLVATVALLTALVAGGAFGRMGHQCTGQPPRQHTLRALRQRCSRHHLRPGRGDQLHAEPSTRDRDRLYGNKGKDWLNVQDSDTRDTVSGGPGYDVCIVDSRAEVGGGCERLR